MTSENSSIKNYPEWYVLERDTEKTINKLSRIEELKFYLRSPDQYFRRLAILRINQLKLKDSISYLEEILDNTSENQINKELAAWSIKSICLKWNIELFVSNRLIYQFSGKEKYHEIYKINIKDSFSQFQVKFAADPVTSKLGLGNDQNPHNQDISFETYFSFQEWLQTCLCVSMITGKQCCISLINKLVTSGYGKVKSINLISLIKKILFGIYYLLLNVHTIKRNKVLKNRTPRKSMEKKGTHLGTLIIDFFYQIIHIFSYPLRLVLWNKTCIIAVLCVVYYLLTFTDAGISATKDRFGISLLEVQNGFLHADLMETKDEISVVVKKTLLIAWVQLKDIADWMYYKWIEEIGVK